MRYVRFLVLLGVLAALAVGLAREAQAQGWSTVTVDPTGDVGEYTSIAVDGNGDPMISYHDVTNGTLKYAICDMSASTNGNCEQTGDWKNVTVDSTGFVGRHTSIAVDGNGDPVISNYDATATVTRPATGAS